MNPKPIPDLTKETQIKIAARIEVRGRDECWKWTGSLDTKGYGRLNIGSSTFKAHRLSLFLRDQTGPRNMCALHRCDNPPCCNPDHLFWGTKVDNVRDRHEKGRNARGDRSGLRVHPERRAFGIRNGAHTHPDRRASGARNGMVKHPESVLRGEKSGMAKVTDSQVLEIRKIYASQKIRQVDLAARFGINQTAVSCILLRKTWAHI